MNNRISLAYLENALNFLRDVMSSPEKRAWCRDFGEDVPQDFREELGEFLLNYRDSGAEKVFGSARRTLDAEAKAAFPLREELSSMSDMELQGQLAGLMEADRPFVLYGISSGLLCRLYEELLLRRQKEQQNGAAYRLSKADLPALEAFCERRFPGHGPEMARLFAKQLAEKLCRFPEHAHIHFINQACGFRHRNKVHRADEFPFFIPHPCKRFKTNQLM